MLATSVGGGDRSVPLILAAKGRASNIQNELVGGGGRAEGIHPGRRTEEGRRGRHADIVVERAAEAAPGTFRRGASERGVRGRNVGSSRRDRLAADGMRRQ
jgi:hypothetical protein